ncbi:histidine-rich glycoprotein-like [Mercenaria mercenaria]|uniref:histidine-rich glycoprotein-like n=1 Tax=Mercenaria mercenaria TaxID=6596 RepID=UPI00234ED750|nr:histidine-rich glycoprotein-like [Mercenaria mercenaria]
MISKTRKTAYIYLLLLSSVIHHTYGQTGIAGHTATTFKQTHSNYYYPSAGFNNFPHPAAKGYFPVSAVNSYNYPLNGQYWTGQPYHYTKYPQYPQYQNQLYWNHPGHYQYHPQQYGFAHPATGYNNHYRQYPSFDAQYWMGHNYYPSHIASAYMHPAPIHPMYMHQGPIYHQPSYYQGHHVMYNGHYPYHAVQYPAYPYYVDHYDRGFFGGTGGELAKGLLGALLVGTVAGTVARRG